MTEKTFTPDTYVVPQHSGDAKAITWSDEVPHMLYEKADQAIEAAQLTTWEKTVLNGLMEADGMTMRDMFVMTRPHHGNISGAAEFDALLQIMIEHDPRAAVNSTETHANPTKDRENKVFALTNKFNPDTDESDLSPMQQGILAEHLDDVVLKLNEADDNIGFILESVMTRPSQGRPSDSIRGKISKNDQLNRPGDMQYRLIPYDKKWGIHDTHTTFEPSCSAEINPQTPENYPSNNKRILGDWVVAIAVGSAANILETIPEGIKAGEAPTMKPEVIPTNEEIMLAKLPGIVLDQIKSSGEFGCKQSDIFNTLHKIYGLDAELIAELWKTNILPAIATLDPAIQKYSFNGNTYLGTNLPDKSQPSEKSIQESVPVLQDTDVAFARDLLTLLNQAVRTNRNPSGVFSRSFRNSNYRNNQDFEKVWQALLTHGFITRNLRDPGNGKLETRYNLSEEIRQVAEDGLTGELDGLIRAIVE
jgi:hypothetical protein